MRKRPLILLVTIAGALVAALAEGQPVPRERIIDTSLEARVKELERQNAELRRFITINGDALTINAPQDLTLKSNTNVVVRPNQKLDVNAGMNVDVRAGTNLSLRASGTGNLESSGAMVLKGSNIGINNGGKPVARVGDTVNVPTANGVVVGTITRGSTTVLAAD